MVPASGIAKLDISIFACKTSAAERDFSMQPGRGVLWRGDFDDAAKLAPIFSGITRRVDTDGIGLLCLKRRRKRRRAVFGKRKPIDHELHLVFGFAWM